MIVRYRVGGVGEGGQIPIPVCQLPPQAHQSHPLHHQCWGDGFSDNETIMVRLSFTGLLQLPRVMGLLSKPTPISPSFRPPPTLSSLNTKNKGQSSHFIGLQRSLSSKNDYTKSFMMQARKGALQSKG